jgi:hypothetical protein
MLSQLGRKKVKVTVGKKKPGVVTADKLVEEVRNRLFDEQPVQTQAEPTKAP